MQLLYLETLRNRIEGRAAAGQATATPKVKYPKLATSARRKSLALIMVLEILRIYGGQLRRNETPTLFKESVVTITW